MPEIKEDRPAYVRFEQRPIEDRNASIAAGAFRSKDTTFAIITPAGTTDELERIADDWFVMLAQQAREGKVNPTFVDRYKAVFEAFKKGEEAPLEGTAIKDWSVLSPAQRKNVIAGRIYTVEDLAQATESALTAIGMGARELKVKAITWLAAANGPGKLMEKMTALEKDNEALKHTVEEQGKVIAALKLVQPVELVKE